MNRLGPTLALGVAVGILVSAYVTAVHAAFALGLGLLLLVAVAWRWSLGAARGLAVTRRCTVAAPVVGGDYQDEIAVTRTGRWPVSLLRVGSGALRDAPFRWVSFGPRRREVWTYRGQFRHRGWHQFGPTQLELSDPFGMFRQRTVHGEPTRVLVMPRIAPLRELREGGSRYPGAGGAGGGWREFPPDPAGVREQQPGEPLNRIHWPTSVRVGRPMVRRFDHPSASDVIVVLDLDRSVHHGSDQESTLEYAVSLAASVVSELSRRGRAVGLAAGPEGRVQVGRGPALRARCLEILAQAAADSEVALDDQLRQLELPVRRGNSLVVVTPSPHSSWMEQLAAMSSAQGGHFAFHIDPAGFGGALLTLEAPRGAHFGYRRVRLGDWNPTIVPGADLVG